MHMSMRREPTVGVPIVRGAHDAAPQQRAEPFWSPVARIVVPLRGHLNRPNICWLRLGRCRGPPVICLPICLCGVGACSGAFLGCRCTSA